MLEPYIAFLMGLGVVVLLVAWLPLALKTVPLSLSIVCVGLGAGLFGLGWLNFDPDPRTYDTIVEKLCEAVVIISLMGAGLKIDRRIGLRSWATTWRLLGLAMPITILAIVLLGVYALGLPVAMALLLGAALAPTDPVLASEVQVGKPRSGEEDEVRFSLTAEAGLNDGLAFPFVHLALAFGMAAAASGAWPDLAMVGGWFVGDVLWRVGAGVGIGYLVGRGLGALTFGGASPKLSGTRDGLVAIGATLVAYASAEVCHGYGFLAVFVAALVLRDAERDHEYHEALHDFSEQIERLLMMLVLVLFGGAITTGLFANVTWTDCLAALAIVLLIRPLAAWVSLLGSGHPATERGLISFFGIRGIGSFYYIAYGVNHGEFSSSERLWAITGLVVLRIGHTGDVGRIDDDGFIYIVDRMKDIIITAGGKNITPSEIENQLKFSPFISDAVVIGDRRAYLTCLVMIDHDNVSKYAQDRNVVFTNYASLCHTKEVQDLIGEEIEKVNTKFARVETIKRFALIDQLLDAEDEELTPTMKLKRKVVNEKYKDMIEAMYSRG